MLPACSSRSPRLQLWLWLQLRLEKKSKAMYNYYILWWPVPKQFYSHNSNIQSGTWPHFYKTKTDFIFRCWKKKKLPGKPKWISGENASAKMPAIQPKRPSSKKTCIKWCFKPNLGIQSLPTMFSFHTVTPGLWCRKKAKLIVRALNDSLNAFRHWMLFQSGSFMGGKYNFQVSKSMAWPKQTQYVTGKTLDIKVGKRLTMDMKHRTPKVQSVMFWL